MSDPMDGHLQPVLSDDEIRALDDATHFHESLDWTLRFARAVEQRVLAALAARAGEAVADMVLVPRKPDQAWWDAVWKSVYADGYARGSASVVQVKRLLDVLHAAMIAAAPPAPSQANEAMRGAVEALESAQAAYWCDDNPLPHVDAAIALLRAAMREEG